MVRILPQAAVVWEDAYGSAKSMVQPSRLSTGFIRFPHNLQGYFCVFHSESTWGGRPLSTLECKRIFAMGRDSGPAQVYQMPLPLDQAAESPELPTSLGSPIPRWRHPSTFDIVVSGTYRKDNEGLRQAFEEFLDLGCRIISPTSVRIASEADGFVFMEGEQADLPEKIEMRHLSAIQEAQFMWLHAPNGYIGLSAALEVGFARAVGIPIFASSPIDDPILSKFIFHTESPKTAIETFSQARPESVPNPLVDAFQKYYKRAAIQRGYSSESARDTVLLMVEEVGELARAIRKKEKLRRHGAAIKEEPSLELADVFIYVVHLANVLGVNLSAVVKEKELLNIAKFSHHSSQK